MPSRPPRSTRILLRPLGSRGAASSRTWTPLWRQSLRSCWGPGYVMQEHWRRVGAVTVLQMVLRLVQIVRTSTNGMHGCNSQHGILQPRVQARFRMGHWTTQGSIGAGYLKTTMLLAFALCKNKLNEILQLAVPWTLQRWSD